MERIYSNVEEGGEWHTFYLYNQVHFVVVLKLKGKNDELTCSQCPKTTALVESIPLVWDTSISGWRDVESLTSFFQRNCSKHSHHGSLWTFKPEDQGSLGAGDPTERNHLPNEGAVKASRGRRERFAFVLR